MVRSVLVHNRIDLSIAMWAGGVMSLTAAASAEGRVCSLFDLIDQPHLCYWLDAPHWAHDGSIVRLVSSSAGDLLRSPRIHHAINNDATAMELRSLFGFANVHAHSYGIDERVFRPHERPAEFDVVFAIGPGDPPPSRLARQLLDSREPDFEPLRHEAAEQVRPRALELADRLAAGGPSLAPRELVNRLMDSQLADRHTPMLERIRAIAATHADLGPFAVRLSRDLPLYVELTRTVRSIESAERAFTFAALSRRFRCATFGPGGEGLSPWTDRVTHLGMLNWHDQAAAYSRGRIGLNIMRWQDDQGLNVKPFEITASGAACLCGKRAGLNALFEPDREIAVFEGTMQAIEQCEALLSNQAGRQALADAGRARTLRDHTWTAVAGRLVESVVGSSIRAAAQASARAAA